MMLSAAKVLFAAAAAPGYAVADQAAPSIGKRRGIDMSKRMKQFKLHDSLMAPLGEDTGVDNRRRLAKNAVRLGIEDHPDRELIEIDFDASKIVVGFDQSLPTPDQGPRLLADRTMDATLQFLDGPGQKPGLPQGSKEFWTGTGARQPGAMWEVMACPVLDVEAYMTEPWRCTFGDNPVASLFDFIAEVDGIGLMAESILDVLIPTLVEVAFSITGAFLETIKTLAKPICELYVILDKIFGVVKKFSNSRLEEATECAGSPIQCGKNVIKKVDGVVGKIGSLLGLRRELTERELIEDDRIGCTVDHLKTCSGNDITCEDCLFNFDYKLDLDPSNTIYDQCKVCGTCYRPYQETVPDMDGLCVETFALQDFLIEPSDLEMQGLNAILLARYQKKIATIEASAIKTNIDQTASAINTNIDQAGDDIHTKIESTCSDSTEAPASRRRLGSSRGAQGPDKAILSSLLSAHLDKLDPRIVKALYLALDTDDQTSDSDSIVESLIELFSEKREAAPNEGTASLFQGPETTNSGSTPRETASSEGVDKEQLRNMLRKSPKFKEAIAFGTQMGLSRNTVEDLFGSLVEEMKALPDESESNDDLKDEVNTAFDRSDFKTEFEEHVRNREDDIIIDAAAKQIRTHIHGRALEGQQEEDLNSQCQTTVDDIQEKIRDGLDATARKIVLGLDTLEEFVEEAQELKNEYSADLGQLDSFVPFIFSISKKLNPLDAGLTLINTPLRIIYRFIQQVTSIFLFGCKPGDADCAELPSIKNKVLTVSENREGEFYLSTGCDIEFEGEVQWAGYALELVEIMFEIFQDLTPSVDAGAAGGVAFANVELHGSVNPFMYFIKPFEFAFKVFQSIWSRLGSTCDYLDGHVQFAKTEATFENSIWALKELACRDPAKLALQRGYGCDGLDNTCDSDKQVDECAEDIFPPQINIDDAMLACSNKVFPSTAEAIACFSSLVTAQDDCKDVDLTIVDTDTTDSQTTIKITATALGCENRAVEDTTIIDIPVLVSKVTLLRGYGCDGIDNNQNGFRNSIDLDQAIDECDEDVFPPEIKIDDAMLRCSNKIFPSATEAISCFSSLITAQDDCMRDVDLSIVDTSTTESQTTIQITATALGCGRRAVEDTTIINVPVLIGGIDLLRGYGCDGFDNNQNGFDNNIDLDQAIDECDEDIFPPEIDATQALARCSDKIFADSQAALDCISSPGWVLAEDDCKQVSLSFSKQDKKCSTDIYIKAVAEGCNDRVLEDTTDLKVELAVDGDAPEVSCSIETQNLRGAGASVFTDIRFGYTAADGGNECTATEDLAVSIAVYSSEVVQTGEEMVLISTPVMAGGTPKIWVEDSVCKAGKCKISSTENSRQYMILVTAVDKAGNVGTSACSTVVGNQSISPEDPLFLLAQTEIVSSADPPSGTNAILG